MNQLRKIRELIQNDAYKLLELVTLVYPKFDHEIIVKDYFVQGLLSEM